MYALPETEAVRRFYADMYADQDALRRCYVALRGRSPRDLEDWAEMCGLSVPQGAFALKVLAEIELAKVNASPFRVDLLPMRKRSPEESALFRRARRAKEETNGLYGL